MRCAPDGLPHVSTYTIAQVLHAAGFRWVAARSWCDTGKAVRVRRSGTVTVIDPDAEARKNLIERAIVKEPDWAWRSERGLGRSVINTSLCWAKLD